MKENRKTMILTCCLCLVPLILGLIFYNKLPDQMPIHWNAAGEVDGYASKAFAVFGLPVFLLAIQIFGFVVVLSDPKKQNQSQVMRLIGFWTIPAIGIMIYPATILTALGYDVPMDTLVMLFVGLLLIIIGNYMPKAKQNYTIGIKLPWTLDDTENWNKTHRLAGFVWVIGGIVFLVCALIPGVPSVVTLSAIIAMMVIPSGYSYWLYQKKKKA